MGHIILNFCIMGSHTFKGISGEYTIKNTRNPVQYYTHIALQTNYHI